MKKTLIILMTLIAGLMAATTPGVVHFVYDNGVVTTSGDDTFYEFDIQAYITGTSSANDLLFGSANVYVEYDTELFGEGTGFRSQSTLFGFLSTFNRLSFRV